MKKVLVLVSAVLLLAAVSTSCSKKGCHCYLKTDVAHVAPYHDDETSTKEECDAIQADFNDDMGMNIVSCTQ